MDKEIIKDTSKQVEEEPKKEFYEDTKTLKKTKIEAYEPKETIEQFFLRKQKETGRVLSPRMKNVFNTLLSHNQGDFEKTWSGLWA
jgi:hypothetical protein